MTTTLTSFVGSLVVESSATLFVVTDLCVHVMQVSKVKAGFQQQVGPVHVKNGKSISVG